jgi:hypothetical protein
VWSRERSSRGRSSDRVAGARRLRCACAVADGRAAPALLHCLQGNNDELVSVEREHSMIFWQ